MKTRKQAQIFTTDFILGFVLFFAFLVIGSQLVISLVPSQEYETLNKDNAYLSQVLTTQGYPRNWTSTDLILPGLFNDEGQITEDRLNNFSAIGYPRTKSLFHVRGEYIFYFENSSQILNITKCIHGYTISFDGNCTPDYNSIDIDNLVNTERLVLYNDSIIRMVIVSWN